MPSGGRFSVENVFRMVDRVTAPITRMENRFRKSFRRMKEGVQRFNDKLSSVGKTARGAFGVAGVAGALLVARAAMGAVISKGAELEQTLVGAAARFPERIQKGTEAFRELEEIARITGATTEFTATQAAGGLNFLAKAGFNAQQSMKLLPGLVDLATASELDLARASDIASDSIGAFGLMTEDATQLQANFTRVSDQMAKTVNSANVDMEQLFETIKKGAPAATAAGVPLETFLGLTAQLANAGLKASDAGTALKNIFLKLADNTVQKKLKSMGVDVLDTSGELRDFADIMDDLTESTANLSGAQRAGIINELFGLRGVTGVATILGQGTSGLRSFREELSGAAGETERLAGQLRDTTAGSIKTLNSAVESLTLSFFKANDSGIRNLIDGLTVAVRWVDAFVQRNPLVSKLILGLLGLVAVGLAIGAVFAAVGAVIGFITASTVAWVAAVVAAVAAGIAWVASLEPVQEFFISIVDWIGRALDKVVAFGSAAGRFAGGLFGFGGDDSEDGAGVPVSSGPSVVGPEERQARMLEETRSVSEATLRIEDETGRASLEEKGTAPGISLQLEPTGAF